MFTSDIAKAYKATIEALCNAEKAASKESKIGKCTCGVKFTGGNHSDWCDTNNPEPDTEELPF